MSNNNNRNEDQSLGVGRGALLAVGAGLIGGLIGYFVAGQNTESAHRHNNGQGGPRSNNSRALLHRPQPVPDEEPESRANAAPSAPKECCICYKSYDHIRRHGGGVIATKCGHLFCDYCIDRSVSSSAKCPICQHRVTRADLIPIYNY